MATVETEKIQAPSQDNQIRSTIDINRLPPMFVGPTPTEYDTVASCYMLNGPSITSIPWATR